MKDVLDVIMWGGFAYVLFIFIRGMNDTQVQKHLDKLEKHEEKNKEKTKGQKNDD